MDKRIDKNSVKGFWIWLFWLLITLLIFVIAQPP
jgi:hypothetical protein